MCVNPSHVDVTANWEPWSNLLTRGQKHLLADADQALFCAILIPQHDGWLWPCCCSHLSLTCRRAAVLACPAICLGLAALDSQLWTGHEDTRAPTMEGCFMLMAIPRVPDLHQEGMIRFGPGSHVFKHLHLMKVSRSYESFSERPGVRPHGPAQAM